MIRLEGVKKMYGGRCVLDVESLTLEADRRYALIGHNGSGKSTLLRILAKVLPPDEGMVHVPDDIWKTAGYMPQRPYAYSFSVLKNVCIALPQSGDRRGDTERARQALARVGMERHEKAKGNKMSGGETQRMAFARMIAVQRRLLLLDEPTSATDIAGTEMVESVLTSYCEQTHCTMVLATHSLAQAQRLADTVILLDSGRIVEFGEAHQVLFRPESAQAQSFLKFWNLEGVR